MTAQKALAAEAKAIREQLAANGYEKAKKAYEEAKSDFDARCEAESGVHNKSDYLGMLSKRVTECGTALRTAESNHRELVERLAQLDLWLGAEDRIKDDCRQLSAHKKTEAAAQADLEAADSARKKLQGLRDSQLEAARIARARAVAEAVAGIASELGEFAGNLAGAPEFEGELLSPEAHEARARAFEDAIDRADAKVAKAGATLAAIRADIDATGRRLLEHRAHAASLAHFDVLQSYLPALAKYRTTHLAAFGHLPDLPRYSDMVDEDINLLAAALQAGASDAKAAGAPAAGFRFRLPWLS